MLRLLIPIFLVFIIGYRSYRSAAHALQFSFDPVIDVSTPGAPQLRGSIIITNPTPNPFYADSAMFNISANGSRFAIAEVTEPVLLRGNSSIEVDPRITLSSSAIADFFRYYTGTLSIAVEGVVNVGPVAIPVSFTKNV